MEVALRLLRTAFERQWRSDPPLARLGAVVPHQCVRCKQDATKPRTLRWFEERNDGLITKGWRCRP